ncbi:helix-turn-helix domain-containing protein [Methylovorus mays]|nr:helix-turn-helix domain-containing protein [Methylovorus mays]
MRTMGIKEAAALLMVHPVTLYRMAERGEVPAAKPGKKWVFIDVDLIEWIRSKYQPQASVSDFDERRNTCHSIDVKIHRHGGSNLLPRMDDDYSKALGLPIS